MFVHALVRLVPSLSFLGVVPGRLIKESPRAEYKFEGKRESERTETATEVEKKVLAGTDRRAGGRARNEGWMDRTERMKLKERD